MFDPDMTVCANGGVIHERVATDTLTCFYGGRFPCTTVLFCLESHTSETPKQ